MYRFAILHVKFKYFPLDPHTVEGPPSPDPPPFGLHTYMPRSGPSDPWLFAPKMNLDWHHCLILNVICWLLIFLLDDRNFNHVLTNFLSSLRPPQVDPLVRDLIIRALVACPDTLQWYLPSLQHLCIPRPTPGCLAMLQFVRQVNVNVPIVCSSVCWFYWLIFFYPFNEFSPVMVWKFQGMKLPAYEKSVVWKVYPPMLKLYINIKSSSRDPDFNVFGSCTFCHTHRCDNLVLTTCWSDW